MRIFDRLPFEIDRQLVTLVLLCARHDLVDLFVGECDRQHAVFEAVVREDIGKRWRDNRPESKLTERPRCMLARRAATKILAGCENRRVVVTLLGVIRTWIRTLVVKQRL